MKFKLRWKFSFPFCSCLNLILSFGSFCVSSFMKSFILSNQRSLSKTGWSIRFIIECHDLQFICTNFRQNDFQRHSDHRSSISTQFIIATFHFILFSIGTILCETLIGLCGNPAQHGHQCKHQSYMPRIYGETRDFPLPTGDKNGCYTE